MKETITPYSNDNDGKKAQVGKMFDRIAPWYDFLNHFLSLGIDHRWRRIAISTLKEKAPKVVLDVATGTGDLALEVERQLHPERIVGLDLSPQMLEVGRKKIAKKNLSDTIEMVVGDSENLPYPADTFDAITVAFGVRNFGNLQAGLREMQRVLKPGGQLVVLEFSQPTGWLFRPLFQAYFKYLLPLIGRLTSKDPRAYSYLYESVQAFPDGEKFMNTLRNCGYQPLKFRPLTFGICTVYTALK